MSFWSVVSPIATIGATAMGGPMAGMAVGGLTGAMAGREKHQQQMEQQKRTAQAAADAQRVSWATRDGKGFVPDIQWAQGTEAGNIVGGGTSGAMMGGMFGQAAGGEGGVNWQDLFGSKGPKTLGTARAGGNYAMPSF